MSCTPSASIVIAAYNYESFLREALDSALGQTYPHTEVIVVDDGSTDRSPEIIAEYGSRITAVLKENGGQASALNAGFRSSRGDVICFMDADDTLLPTAIEKAVPLFSDPDVVKVHWPLRAIDAKGRPTGQVIPATALAEGNLREATLRDGPANYSWPPTTGNAWARSFLEEILPIPEEECRISADFYLSAMAPAFGSIGRVREPQGCYRRHGRNNYSGRRLVEKLRGDFERWDLCCNLLDRHYRLAGIAVDVEGWKERSWCHRLERVAQELNDLVAEGDTVILVDEDQLRHEIGSAAFSLPFLERDGQYGGPPPNAEVAISELERMRGSGADWLVFAWPAFWWLEHYDGLDRYLRQRFPCVLENHRLVVFDLHPLGSDPR